MKDTRIVMLVLKNECGGCFYRQVGEKYLGSTVSRIEYYSPDGEGDAHYCDICYVDSDGKDAGTTRIFRPDHIEFKSS
jgi:hypothetical protein